MIEDTEYGDEVFLWIKKVKKDGRVLIAQLLRATKSSLRLPRGSSKRDTGFPFSLIPTSERQISPAKKTGRSVEVQR